MSKKNYKNIRFSNNKMRKSLKVLKRKDAFKSQLIALISRFQKFVNSFHTRKITKKEPVSLKENA